MSSSTRVAFITGAASGIGRAIALRLATSFDAVAIADLDAGGGGEVAAEVESAGAKAAALECDVADIDAVRAAAREVSAEFGGIDALINNAGFDIPSFFLESDPATWDRLIAVNLMGVLNCSYVVGPLVVERCRETGYGRIVNVASDAGRVGSLGEAVYSAAKGGVIAFTKALAREVARDRVTVNAVCPGPAETPMTEAIRKQELGRKLIGRLEAATPLKRLVRPEEVAAGVEFFLSDDARFATAQVLSLSGGLTIPA